MNRYVRLRVFGVEVFSPRLGREHPEVTEDSHLGGDFGFVLPAYPDIDLTRDRSRDA